MSPIVVLALPHAEQVRSDVACLGVDTTVAATPRELADICTRGGDLIAAVVVAIDDTFSLQAIMQLRENETTAALPAIVHIGRDDRAQVLLAYAAGATDVLTITEGGTLDRELLRLKIAAFADLWEERRALRAETLGPTVPELRESLMDATVEVALTRARIEDARARETLNGLEQHLRRLSWVVGRMPTRHRA
jgi:PleD family two-component response regulator